MPRTFVRGPCAALAAVAAVTALLASAACSDEPTTTAPVPTRAVPVAQPTAAPAAQATQSVPATQPTQAVPRLGPDVPPPGPLRPFVLPRSGGGTLALSDYLGKQPLVVVFYRGFF